jgi:hypothetical protein
VLEQVESSTQSPDRKLIDGARTKSLQYCSERCCGGCHKAAKVKKKRKKKERKKRTKVERK